MFWRKKKKKKKPRFLVIRPSALRERAFDICEQIGATTDSIIVVESAQIGTATDNIVGESSIYNRYKLNPDGTGLGEYGEVKWERIVDE